MVFSNFFSLFSAKTYVVGTHQKHLGFYGKFTFQMKKKVPYLELCERYGECPKISNILFHSFCPNICFLCSCFLKDLVEWQIV